MKYHYGQHSAFYDSVMSFVVDTRSPEYSARAYFGTARIGAERAREIARIVQLQPLVQTVRDQAAGAGYRHHTLARCNADAMGSLMPKPPDDSPLGLVALQGDIRLLPALHHSVVSRLDDYLSRASAPDILLVYYFDSGLGFWLAYGVTRTEQQMMRMLTLLRLHGVI